MAKRKEADSNIKIEKVKIEKEGPRVIVTGAYTKRQLRHLLLSSISLLPVEDTREQVKKEQALEETGLSPQDYELIKNGYIEELSAEGRKILKDLRITGDVIAQVTKKDKKKDVKKKEELLEEEIIIKKTFEDFLREKGISENLIKRLLENGLTDELIRLLKALGFTDEDIEKLRLMWQLEQRDQELLDEIDSFASCPSSSDEYLSMDGIYLKNFLSKPLSNALREIVMKKPSDPIEYLGYWLLNFKVCEERRHKRQQFELELMIERERLRMMGDKIEDKISIDRDGEEAIEEDWHFYNYEGV